jgi:hypothetical protein
VKDEMGHSLGMAHGVVDCNCPSGPQAQQSEPVTLCCLDDGLQILDLPRQTEIGAIAI